MPKTKNNFKFYWQSQHYNAFGHLHMHTKEYGKDSISYEYYRVQCHIVHLQKSMCTTIHNEQFYVHINILSSTSVGIVNQVISSDCNLIL